MNTWVKVMLWCLGIQVMADILALGMGLTFKKGKGALASNVIANGAMLVWGLVLFMSAS